MILPEGPAPELTLSCTCADGTAHGVLLWNSNGMDAVLTEDRVSFRVTGGVLDLYLFLGPTPMEVLEQYTRLFGRPALPPLWALGFHQSKCAPSCLKLCMFITSGPAAVLDISLTLQPNSTRVQCYRGLSLKPEYPSSSCCLCAVQVWLQQHLGDAGGGGQLHKGQHPAGRHVGRH